MFFIRPELRRKREKKLLSILKWNFHNESSDLQFRENYFFFFLNRTRKLSSSTIFFFFSFPFNFIYKMDKLESTRIFREIFLKYLETLEQFDGRKKVGSSSPPPLLSLLWNSSLVIKESYALLFYSHRSTRAPSHSQRPCSTRTCNYHYRHAGRALLAAC